MKATRSLASVILWAVAWAGVSSHAQAAPLQRVEVVTPEARSVADDLLRAGFDVLEGATTRSSLEIVVTERDRQRLEDRGFEFRVLETGRPFRDIQAERARAMGRGGVPAGYPDLDEVIAQMQAAADSFPAICEFVDLTASLGASTTFEGRSLYAVKISDNVASDEDEPTFLMVSTHHCREIVTPVIALDAIERLTTLYGSDATVTQVVNDNEIWIAPMWNPDGYVHVFDVENLWRKNRRVFAQGTGVDLNRNYPHGWTNACSGSSTPSSIVYKGPSAASESETQTMLAFSERERFAKVLDYHSFGEEVLHGYSCWSHPFDDYFEDEAISLSSQAGYAGAVRPPSADGEHYQWQIAGNASLAFLMETSTVFQPSYASALSEAAQVWPATLSLLQRPIPLTGIVTDSLSTLPLEATITLVGVAFLHGEIHRSDPTTGRYHAFAPLGTYDVRFEVPGYVTKTISSVGLNPSTSLALDVALVPDVTSVNTWNGEVAELVSEDPLRGLLRYRVPGRTRVALSVFDVRGAEVAKLHDEANHAGTYRIQWDGRVHRGGMSSSGTYFYRLDLGASVYTGKFVRVR